MRGQDAEPVIIDFGFAVVLDDDNQQLHTRIGTPFYIAPEASCQTVPASR